ncbi:hypothetical protein V8G54_004237 [Vigna mungo]|uniref:Retrovirus-related Pol polyprotein from transposon TNT 1-94-like beta-barrel domain-containing protein n=1 Tax=Vigna mungo TaxID=3915 RepID=A0AAQ3PCB2_VIGMU
MKEYRENDCVLCFLRGLNDNYSVVRSQILLMNPLPSLTKKFSMIIQHERQLQPGFLPEPPIMAAQVSQSIPSFSTSNGRGKPLPANDYGRGKPSYQGSQTRSSWERFGAPRQCTHYGRTNHTIDTFFLLHGLPPRFSIGFKSKRVHNVTIDSSTTIPSSSNSQAQSSTLGLSQEQIHGLLPLLPQSNPITTYSTNLVSSHNVSTSSQAQGNIYSQWILDTSAIDHISSSLSHFTSYHKIKPITVSLPNKNSSFAHFSGTISLSPHLTLHNVLFVTNFSVSLISVTKLTKYLSCKLDISEFSCQIQDKSTM